MENGVLLWWRSRGMVAGWGRKAITWKIMYILAKRTLTDGGHKNNHKNVCRCRIQTCFKLYFLAQSPYRVIHFVLLHCHLSPIIEASCKIFALSNFFVRANFESLKAHGKDTQWKRWKRIHLTQLLCMYFFRLCSPSSIEIVSSWVHTL